MRQATLYSSKRTISVSGRRVRMAGGMSMIAARVENCVAPLTPRQREVAHYLIQGRTYKEIATLMGIKAFTVTKHVHAVYERLSIGSKAELAARHLRSATPLSRQICGGWSKWSGFRLPEPWRGTPPRTMLETMCNEKQGVFKVYTLGNMPTATAKEAGFLDPLTPRQREVAHHLVQGRTYKETATLMGIKAFTVTNHVNAIYQRLGIHSKTRLVTLHISQASLFENGLDIPLWGPGMESCRSLNFRNRVIGVDHLIHCAGCRRGVKIALSKHANP